MIVNNKLFVLCIIILGCLELCPGAIKDEEGVGECSQVFNIATCEDDAGVGRKNSNNLFAFKSILNKYYFMKC